jgi:SlyX protein
MNSIEEQLVDLQTRFAFQEDHLQELNHIVMRQQQQIEMLEKELFLHREKLVELVSDLSERVSMVDAESEKPPHY